VLRPGKKAFEGVKTQMAKNISRNDARLKRHQRIRKKISGTAVCPRLNVYRSLNHIYAQVIDDIAGVTLAQASSLEKDFADNGGNKAAARKVGQILAKRAIDKGITEVKFDRGGFLYHGRIQELAEGAREGGLKF
jgi:large subunit ribosomal protein L18